MVYGDNTKYRPERDDHVEYYVEIFQPTDKTNLRELGWIIVAALIFVALVPFFRESENTFNRTAALEQFDTDLRWTRSAAMSNDARLVLMPLADGTGYDVGFDYIPYGRRAEIDSIEFRTELPRGITLHAPPIVFDSSGQSIDPRGELQELTATLMDEEVEYLAATISGSAQLN